MTVNIPSRCSGVNYSASSSTSRRLTATYRPNKFTRHFKLNNSKPSSSIRRAGQFLHPSLCTPLVCTVTSIIYTESKDKVKWTHLCLGTRWLLLLVDTGLVPWLHHGCLHVPHALPVVLELPTAAGDSSVTARLIRKQKLTESTRKTQVLLSGQERYQYLFSIIS